MKTIMNTISKTSGSADGLSTMLALSIGLALAFLMVTAAPATAHAQYDSWDSGWGDTGSYDTSWDTGWDTTGYSSDYGSYGCGYDCYGSSDSSWDTGWDTTGYSSDYGSYGCGYDCYSGYTDYGSYPTYTDYGYYPSYGGYDTGSLTLNYNNNENHNTNNNNIYIGGPSTTPTPTYTCAQFGMEGTYPNCHNTPQSCPAGYTGTYPNCYPPQNNQPSCDISASDTSISQGDSTTLHWTSDYALSASLSGYGSVSTNGSKTVSPDSDTMYTLKTSGNYGASSCSVTVHVNGHSHQNAPSCDLWLSDDSINEGDSTTLHWDTNGNVDTASINHGIGDVSDSGSKRVSPDSDTTYRMTVENSDGDSDTCSVTLNVDQNNNQFSSTVFTDEPPQNPNVVYLSSIPYTGLEDITPEMWAYWLLLLAGASAGIWFFFGKSLMNRFSFVPVSGGFMHAENETENAEEASPEAPEETAVDAFMTALADNDGETALTSLRTAAANGTGVEEFLAQARASVASEHPMAAKLDAAIAESVKTGVRGAKLALGF